MNPVIRRKEPPFLPPNFLRKSLLPLCLAGAIGMSDGPAWAQDAQELNPDADPIEATEWGPVLKRYVEDPVGTREDMIGLARNGTDGLPPMALVMVGDAYLRSGNDATARRLFALVADQGPQSREAAAAHLGLGMISVRTGNLSDARANFEMAAKVPSESVELTTQLGQLGAGTTAAAMGDHDEALEILGELSGDHEAPAGVVRSAEFASASTLMAAGKYEEAAKAFDELAKLDGAAGFDARYAAARARLAGETDGGQEALEKLVQDCDGTDAGDEQPRRNARGVRDLQPAGVLRTWIDNYNELTFDGFYGEAGPLYDLGGCELARTTLASLEKGEDLAAPSGQPAERIPVAQGEDAPAAPDEPARPAAPAPAAPSAEGSGPWLWVGILVAGGAALLVLLNRLRRKD